ncbi:hypothetical protein KHM83_14175 [Fusibacter paucivorans]|uniref:Uncharacterized protein n=1 Tax=Fusibacter paucivorans TaxID=76009 RepID=A0ABS5PRN3_9FIRM|nr:hypothetical protein [Fusibacter paucivorans]MBS7527828.1 hypothetical protein [Fusibacter paucivorans]
MDFFLASIGTAAFLLIAVLLLSGIVGYILSALGLMRMAQNRGIDNAWLAWIPVGNLWIMGQLIGPLRFGDKSYDHAEHILVVGLLLSVVLSRVPVIGALLRIIMSLLTIYTFFMIFKQYAEDRAVLYTVISILLPTLVPGILFFSMRFNEPNMLTY